MVEPSESHPPPPGRGPSREYRATVAFTIGGAAIVLVLLLLSGSLLQSAPPIRGVVALAGVLLGIVAMLGTAYGLALDRGPGHLPARSDRHERPGIARGLAGADAGAMRVVKPRPRSW